MEHERALTREGSSPTKMEQAPGQGTESGLYDLRVGPSQGPAEKWELQSLKEGSLKKDKAGRTFSHQSVEGVDVHILRDYCL